MQGCADFGVGGGAPNIFKSQEIRSIVSHAARELLAVVFSVTFLFFGSNS